MESQMPFGTLPDYLVVTTVISLILGMGWSIVRLMQRKDEWVQLELDF